jgi:hypothetical protein
MPTGESILPNPPVPRGILDAVDNKSLAVFVGAGVSRLIGCMGWDELASNLLAQCNSVVDKKGRPLLNFREVEQLTGEQDRRRIITICHHLLSGNGKQRQFYKTLRQSL